METLLTSLFINILNLNLNYLHSDGAYMAGKVPKSATKFFAVALVLVAEAHAQSTLPTTPDTSFAPPTFGVKTNVLPSTPFVKPTDVSLVMVSVITPSFAI